MMDEEIRQAVSEVREMKQMCGNINMKLTNIVTQRGQDWKKKLEAEYQRGLEDGKKAFDLLESERNSEYQRGLSDGNDIGYKDGVKDGQNEAWECAKKIALMDTETSENVTGYFGLFRIMENLTPMQAIEKLKAYEEKQEAADEIKVGDEVEVLNSGSKYLIAWIAGTSICGFSHDGITCNLQPSHVRKTGRHFDIASILEDMRND